MRLGNIKKTPGATRNNKRLGRGAGSGTGKTSGKGHKGQKSRSGASMRPTFEGGQMPLNRRLPKKGFTNIFRVGYQPVNLYSLEKIDREEIALADIYEAGLASKKSAPVKVLGKGEITRAVKISAHAFSKSAVQKIEAAGGKVEVIK
ncbi:MAG: 50S ribosomal protein L15 [candidate division Zixibacteria bacterium]|nr:50S ribosomal protein L15 [candidate division Zixibacteria bacterium]